MNGAISTHQFQDATQEDSTLQTAISYMNSQWPVRKSLHGDIQGLYDIYNKLSVRTDYFTVVPSKLSQSLFDQIFFNLLTKDILA